MDTNPNAVVHAKWCHLHSLDKNRVHTGDTKSKGKNPYQMSSADLLSGMSRGSGV